jgi:hypothetical protein
LGGQRPTPSFEHRWVEGRQVYDNEAEIRRQRREAERSLLALLEAAEAGLAGLPPEKGERVS